MPDHGHTVSRTELDTLLLKHAESAGAEVRQWRRGRPAPSSTRTAGSSASSLKSGEKVLRRRGHRRRRRLLPHQAGPEDRLGVQRLLGDRDPLGDARQPAGLRQPRHLPQAGVPGRPAAGLRLGVPDGRRPVQHRPGLRQQLQELAVRSMPPNSSASSCGHCRPSGSCRRSRSSRRTRACARGDCRWVSPPGRPLRRPGVLFTGDSLGAGKPGIRRRHLQGAGIRLGRRRNSAMAALSKRRAGRLHQLSRRGWKRRGAGSTGGAATSTSWRASRRGRRTPQGSSCCDNGRGIRDVLLLRAMYKKAQGPQHTLTKKPRSFDGPARQPHHPRMSYNPARARCVRRLHGLEPLEHPNPKLRRLSGVI